MPSTFVPAEICEDEILAGLLLLERRVLRIRNHCISPIVKGLSLNKSQSNSEKTVTVVGGGVAGMSAACALAEAGLRVQLVERRGYLGGRASSYLHPGVNEVIDNCQHVLFGCCTNLIGFYRRIGVADHIHWTSEMTMIEPGGRRSVLGPVGSRRRCTVCLS